MRNCVRRRKPPPKTASPWESGNGGIDFGIEAQGLGTDSFN